MLTKAILTGGVLSLLAGSIVYFGSEGADAMDFGGLNFSSFDRSSDEISTIKTDGMATPELAGAVDVVPQPDKAKPKTRWLDQYLKASKSKEKPTTTDSQSVEDVEQDGARDDATGTYRISDDSPDVIVIARDAKSEVVDVKVETSGDLAEVFGVLSPRPAVNYDRVLQEAEKLLVIDMRNEAFLEIVDYAVERGDMEKAIEISEVLSSPELRDTARARIGKGLALRGDAEAAFAIIDDVEIGELAAPIRLEIIAALMTTQEERIAASVYGRRGR